jgi:hypothetical protein
MQLNGAVHGCHSGRLRSMETVFDESDLEKLIDKVAGGSRLSDEHRRSPGSTAAN